jgi:hypothetical protein
MSDVFMGLPHGIQEGKQLQQRYEDLRAQATGAGLDLDRRGHGLSLFLDQGMVAWMKAWGALGDQGGTTSVGRTIPAGTSMPALSSLPPGIEGNCPASTPHPIELQNQLAMLLAGLALQIARSSPSTSAASRAVA